MSRPPRQYVIASKCRDGTIHYYAGCSASSESGRWTPNHWAAETFDRNTAYALAADIRGTWKLRAKVETRTEMAR